MTTLLQQRPFHKARSANESLGNNQFAKRDPRMSRHRPTPDIEARSALQSLVVSIASAAAILGSNFQRNST
jgi:hypothetical protein